MAKVKHKDGTRVYIVWDARTAGGDTDEASVFESFNAENDHKAKLEARKYWREHAYVLYGYTFKDNQAVQDDAPLAKHWC